MNEMLRDEILDQPEAVRQTLPAVRSQLVGLRAEPARFARLIYTGSGDSYFAPLAFEYAARMLLKQAMRALPAREAARYWRFTSDDMLIAISISGEAACTIEAARVARASGAFVLAVTASPDSALARVSSATLTLPFRSRSRQTPHTTDYLSTLVAVAAHIEWAASRRVAELDDLAEIVSRSAGRLEAESRRLAQELVAAGRFTFLAAGPNLANAGYAASKFYEAGGLPAFYFELEEFAHGPHLMVEAGDPVFILAPSGQSLKRAGVILDGLHQIQAIAVGIGDDPRAFADAPVLQTAALPEEWSPLVTCLPLQWLCWAVATARGYDVLAKDGIHRNPAAYESAHRAWVRAPAENL